MIKRSLSPLALKNQGNMASTFTWPSSQITVPYPSQLARRRRMKAEPLVVEYITRKEHAAGPSMLIDQAAVGAWNATSKWANIPSTSSGFANQQTLSESQKERSIAEA